MKINPVVFFVSSILIILFVVTGAIFEDAVGGAFAFLQDWIVENFGWFYIVSVAFFLVFVIWLMVSPYGKVRLGKDNEEPTYSYLTWFAMLFSAGMGIGLLFFSVAEPISHFANPPAGPGGAEPESIAAAREAINITFFHWGLHAWAIYIVVGLSLAYFAYRHDLPLTIRSTLYPLLGKRIHGPIGDVVDIFAVFGTLFGLATSLGLGVQQVNAGLDYLGLLPVGTTNQIILIAVITVFATISVVTGVDVGIRRLSEANLTMALLLLLFVFIAGPTVFLLSSFVQGIGHYASSVVQMTFKTDAYIGLEWQKSWTMFYWGWWVSWSPFVGMFIARVSRGRTVREFIAGVLLVPTVLTFFWMVVFGDTAIWLELFGGGEPGIVEAVSGNMPTAIFVTLEQLPWAPISATLATIVVAIFFVTSSDSGSLVVDILTSGGHPDPPIAQRVFWALTEGAVAAILLVTGGLLALQTAALTTALPFCAVMLGICWALVKGLRAERITPAPLTDVLGNLVRLPEAARRAVVERLTGGSAPQSHYAPPKGRRSLFARQGGSQDWREQLKQIVENHDRHYRAPARSIDETKVGLKGFLENTVLPAFEQIRQQLEASGRTVQVKHDDERAELTVYRGEEEEFAYAIVGHARDKAVFAFPEFTTQSKPRKTTAQAVTRSGHRAELNTSTFTQEQVIRDFLDAYAKWMGW